MGKKKPNRCGHTAVLGMANTLLVFGGSEKLKGSPSAELWAFSFGKPLYLGKGCFAELFPCSQEKVEQEKDEIRSTSQIFSLGSMYQRVRYVLHHIFASPPFPRKALIYRHFILGTFLVGSVNSDR